MKNCYHPYMNSPMFPFSGKLNNFLFNKTDNTEKESFAQYCVSNPDDKDVTAIEKEMQWPEDDERNTSQKFSKNAEASALKILKKM